MVLLTLEELSHELSVPCDFIYDLINKKILIPFGGRARLGEPKFSQHNLAEIRSKVQTYNTHEQTISRTLL
jgi:hypothetical protein